MSESPNHQSSSINHAPLQPSILCQKYNDADKIIPKIKERIRSSILVEPAVKLSLESPKSNSERAIISIPFPPDQENFLTNFAKEIYQNLMGYCLNSDPKSTHFGLSKKLLEGRSDSLLQREVEAILETSKASPETGKRLLKNVSIVMQSEVPKPGKTYLSKVIKDGLNIQAGYRVILLGKNINHTRVFLPMNLGPDIGDLIYFNIEKILNQTFAVYDETNSGFIKITEGLIFKELESTLRRTTENPNTRKKILNNLQFEIIFSDLSETQKDLVKDKLYDRLNGTKNRKINALSQQSTQLYASTLSQTNPNSLTFSQTTSINIKKDLSPKLQSPQKDVDNKGESNVIPASSPAKEALMMDQS